MAKTIKTNDDIKVAMILTVKNGDKYLAVADDNGHKDVINLMNGKSNGIEVGTHKIAVCGGTNGSRDVVKIEEFAAVPTRNRLSEGLKYMTRRCFTEELTTVWTAEDPRLTAAKAKAAEAEKALAAARAEIARYS